MQSQSFLGMKSGLESRLYFPLPKLTWWTISDYQLPSWIQDFPSEGQPFFKRTNGLDQTDACSLVSLSILPVLFSKTRNEVISNMFSQWWPISHKCIHIANHVFSIQERVLTEGKTIVFPLNSVLPASWSHTRASVHLHKVSSLLRWLKLSSNIFRSW